MCKHIFELDSRNVGKCRLCERTKQFSTLFDLYVEHPGLLRYDAWYEAQILNFSDLNNVSNRRLSRTLTT